MSAPSAVSAARIGWRQHLAQLEPHALVATLDERPAICYTLALLIAFAAKLPTLHNSVIFIDEPSYLDEAARLDTPLKFLYSAQYIAETKFPLGLLPYMIAQGLSHAYALLLLHIFGLLAVTASAILLLAISRRAFGSYLPGLLAAGLWCMFLTEDEGTISTLLEYFQVPLVLAALWQFAGWVKTHSAGRLLDRGSLRSLLSAGVLVGASVLVKPPSILVAPVLALGVLFATVAEEGMRARIYAALVPLVGATVAVGVFVLPYLVHPDALGALLFNMVGLSTQYSANQGGVIARLNALLAKADLADAILVVMAVINHTAMYASVRSSGSRNREERRQNAIRLVLLGTGLSLLAGYMAGEAKSSYVVAILPPLALYAWDVMTLAIHWIGRSWVGIGYAVVWIGLLLPGLPSTLPSQYQQLYSPYWTAGQRYADLLPGVDASALATTIDAHSRPGDYIWVYYNAPEIYWLADRKPATDEPVGTWLVDYYDQFWFQRTVQQLEAERPTVIVGLDGPRYLRPRAPRLLDLPLVGAYIQSNYRCRRASQAEVGGPAGVDLCILRPRAGP